MSKLKINVELNERILKVTFKGTIPETHRGGGDLYKGDHWNFATYSYPEISREVDPDITYLYFPGDEVERDHDTATYEFWTTEEAEKQYDLLLKALKDFSKKCKKTNK